MAGYVAEHGRTSTPVISAGALLPPLGLDHHLLSARHLPISEPPNPTFLSFQESLLERAHQSGSFPVPFCFSLGSKSRLMLGHLSTDLLPLKRRRQVSVLFHFTAPHSKSSSCLEPLPTPALSLCHTSSSSFPTCKT